MSNMQNVLTALKEYYAYFYGLYQKYEDYLPKESTFENELAIALDVEAIQDETKNLVGLLEKSKKIYLEAKNLRKSSLDIYHGLESAHPNAFVSYSTKYSMHSHFIDDFFDWIGLNGKDYVLNENTVGIHETNVIRNGLVKYRHMLKKQIASMKSKDKEEMLKKEIEFLKNFEPYIDKLYSLLSNLLKIEQALVIDEETKKSKYFESIEKIISQINTDASLVDDKDFANNLSPKIPMLSKISTDLSDIRKSRLSVSFEYEYNKEQKLLNELLNFLN
jgi:hypothetical protein